MLQRMKDYCPRNLCHNIPLTSLYIRDKGKQIDRQTDRQTDIIFFKLLSLTISHSVSENNGTDRYIGKICQSRIAKHDIVIVVTTAVVEI